MRVEDIEVVAVPGNSTRVRLRADVRCDNASIPDETYWLEAPASYAPFFSGSGNSWLALLAPMAVRLREPLLIEAPVDRNLLVNVCELMRVWQCWYPKLEPVAIEPQVLQEGGCRSGDATATMFSGGIDAWFTFLSHEPDASRHDRCRIDDLLCVWGLDVSLDRPCDFALMRDTLRRATADHEATLVDLATNLHDVAWWNCADWGQMGHGCALASMALALEGRYSTLLIPSTHTYRHLVPWGSHPVTDPLLSSSGTRILHDGAAYNRTQKTALVASSPAALETLQVCWSTRSYSNCGRCTKCYRTMATLHMLGALNRCPRFPAGAFSPEGLARVYVRTDSDRIFFQELRDDATAAGRPDVAGYIAQALAHSRRLDRVLAVTARLSRIEALQAFSDAVEWRVLARSIL